MGQVFNGQIVIAGDAVLTAVVMNRNGVCSMAKAGERDVDRICGELCVIVYE